MYVNRIQLSPLVQQAANVTLLTAFVSIAALYAAQTFAGEPPAKAPSFAALDLNQDQFIDAKEAQSIPPLAKHFTEADSDKDGKLSPSEFEALSANLSAKFSK